MNIDLINNLNYIITISNNSYYLGTPENFISQQHLYRVSAIPPTMGASLRQPLCLTCSPFASEPGQMTSIAAASLKAQVSWDVSDDDDNAEDEIDDPSPTAPSKRKRKKGIPFISSSCQYFSAIFAPNSNEYALLDCLGPEVPSSWIYRISVDPKNEPIEPIFVLQNNTELKERVARIAMPQIKTFPVMISGGYYAQVRQFLPPGLREDEITKYPMVVHVYSGPGTQLVTDKWRIDWNTYLAGTKDYIVTQIDGRGSSGQGYQLLHEVYRRLGTIEVSDQLEVTEYLRDTLHYVDKRRVGIWGWSYGGYTAALALSTSSLFQCGISVAPVTNWKLYGET